MTATASDAVAVDPGSAPASGSGSGAAAKPSPSFVGEIPRPPGAPAPDGERPASTAKGGPRGRPGRAKAVRRARRVQRVVRHVDAWSVLKLSLLFYLCLFIVVMVAGIILWNLAAAIGTIDDIEKLVTELGLFESFEFEPDKLLRASLLGGLILVIVGAGFNVLVVAMFNLISDLIGGIRITVIEEETARLPVPAAAPGPVASGAAADGAPAPGSTATSPSVADVGGVQPAGGAAS